MSRRASTCLLLATALLLTGAAKVPAIVESWSSGQGARFYKKVIVVGITQDRQVRHHFENKFVSHLRSRGMEGVTSYSLVPDLTALPDREEIRAAIREMAIDGAISVRPISLKDRTEEEWSAAWKGALGPSLKLRDVIRGTEPIALEKVKLYGIEIAVWDAGVGALVWAGRTDPYKRKQLRDSGGVFVTTVLNLLEDQKVLTRQ